MFEKIKDAYKSELEQLDQRFNAVLEARIKEISMELTKINFDASNYTIGNGTEIIGKHGSTEYKIYSEVVMCHSYEKAVEVLDYMNLPQLTEQQFDLMREFQLYSQAIQYGLLRVG